MLSIFEISYLSVASFAIIFSHSEGCLFTLLIASFVVQTEPRGLGQSRHESEEERLLFLGGKRHSRHLVLGEAG